MSRTATLSTIRNSELTAIISARGAELQSLVPAGGENVIWSADPAFWPWHAPNLFPIVGALVDDTLIHQGRRYPMKQHGFLRHTLCEAIGDAGAGNADAGDADAGDDGPVCAFRLTDTEATRAQYPFKFELTIAYRLSGDRLEVQFTLANPARDMLYASLGAHPAFRWPLGGAARDSHEIHFEAAEPEPLRALDHGLLKAEPRASPVAGRVLRLAEGLFADDALIFDRPVSRRLTYGAPGGPALELGFPDFPYFGVWSRPTPAPFVCLEPWQGIASPVDFRGEFRDKPGIVALAPGETRDWRYWIRPLSGFPASAADQALPTPR
jgi:galactose mutarotase-like enzyme